jgi:hypothetical protein
MVCFDACNDLHGMGLMQLGLCWFQEDAAAHYCVSTEVSLCQTEPGAQVLSHDGGLPRMRAGGRALQVPELHAGDAVQGHAGLRGQRARLEPGMPRSLCSFISMV